MTLHKSATLPRIRQTERGWILETHTLAYALGINRAGYLVNTYWGAPLPYPDDYPAPPESGGWASFNGPGQRLPEEYPAYGGQKFTEPALKVTFATGVRDCVLRFSRAKIDHETGTLTLILYDAAYPLVVKLHYRLHAEYGLLERWAELINEGETPITIERAFSALWHLPAAPAGAYCLQHLAGRWLDEFHIRRETLQQGVKVLESRRIHTSHHHNPYFAVTRAGSGEEASEAAGEVWFGLLAWSGNWKIAAEVTDFNSTRVHIGLNDWDFAWQLAPGERFETPRALAGYTREGYGAASRTLHQYIREEVLPHPHTVHPVLYNSWEATLFDVTEAGQKKLAERAAALGVELFVVDDGWFRGRNFDNAGLGDWTPDSKKFPGGLAPLIARVNALGMGFGLWIEPEMVNPDSDLYRAHPDWVIHFPARQRTQARNQLILNMGRADVQDYLIEHLDALLSQHNIQFIKWDMNRSVSEPGWPGAREPREIWVRYVQGLYRVWDTLRERHPQVVFQSCSGGGGRVDVGILHRADQVWPSDNTDPIARLSIQEGFSHAYPAQIMEAWVTDSGRGTIPLRFRFHVAMTGVLGVGGNLTEWTAAELAEAKARIAEYKSIRSLVQHGEQFRLLPVQRDDGLQHAYSAVQYMDAARQEGVLFVFRTLMPEPVDFLPIKLQGLDPTARYAVEGIEGVRSGAAWMTLGGMVELASRAMWGESKSGNLQSTVRHIRQV